jgi:hypothetical protein
MGTKQEPREDFPVDTFKYLEEKLQILCRYIMEKAADNARKECPDTAEAFVVTQEHVKQAIREVVGTALWSHV